eukprot:TRINITY_DN3476_c0_g1_i1.p1 TRINITY_DN3476_c0_g1~~TRINITY_DN3476_c0_g1_i1.p1  ORF type:complete len:302 (-),score=100.37 TRINITY_DN3476_c0_g1_i1:135-1040(-)
MEELSQKHREEFDRVTKLKYKEQCGYFLNAFWDECGSNAEDIWKHLKVFYDLDKQQYNALPAAKKPETYTEADSLDEFWSHKFLETVGKALTAIEFRNEFKKIDSNVDKRMGIVEFLLWEYKQTVKTLVSRPQGSGDGGELIKAQALLEEVNVVFTAAEKRRDEAATAEAELKAEVQKLKEQEDAYNSKTEELKAKSEAGGVAGMRAKNELAQHLQEDPLPLRKAKLSTEAATKKAEKARKAADEAYEQAAKKLKEAEDYLNEVKSRGQGPALGTIWMMERELKERKSYLPSSGKNVKLVV